MPLYEEHVDAVFTFCLRVTGSAQAAADATRATFSSVEAADASRLELLSAASAACAERASAGDAPAEPIPVTGDFQDEARAANALLPPRQREVLVLREVEQLSYGEVAAVTSVPADAVAQTAWRARLNVRGAMCHGTDFRLPPVPEECERALMLLTLAEDGPLGEADSGWLTAHVDSCRLCAANRGAMLAGAATYRAWTPVAAPAGLAAVVAEGRRSQRPPAALLVAGLIAALALGIGIFALARASTDAGELRAGPVSEAPERPSGRLGTAPPPTAEAGEPAAAPRSIRASGPAVASRPAVVAGPVRVERHRVAASPGRAVRPAPRARRRIPARARRPQARRPARRQAPRRPAAPVRPVATPSTPVPHQAAAPAPTSPERVELTAAQPQPQVQDQAPAAPQAEPTATPVSDPAPDRCAGTAGNQGLGIGQGRPACPGNGNASPQGPQR